VLRGLADAYTASGSGLTYIDDISNIGTNWKSFTFPAGPWVIEDSAAYFVLTQQGKIWRIVFTGFGGSATGTSYFDKTLLYTGIESVNANLTAATIYPNPGASNSVLVFNNNNGTSTQIQIFDLNGALINSQKMNTTKGLNQFAIGQLNLDKGMYMVQISDGNETSSLKYVVTY
jgi:Secretion system C-terminal sorting domain